MSGQQLRIYLTTLSNESILLWAAALLDNALEPPILSGTVRTDQYSEEETRKKVLRLVARIYGQNVATYAQWVGGSSASGEVHARIQALLNQGFSGLTQKKTSSRRRQSQITGKRKSAPGRARILRLLEIQGDKCHWCGKTVSLGVAEKHPDRATVEHLTPVSRGGSDRRENLKVACFRCNNRRSSRDGPMPPEGW